MIDTSRHFYPVSSILAMIDAISFNRMNVLHWHISDSQAFPGGSETYPELAEKGAYLYPEAAYSIDDFKGLVEYARLRGVRVMPEWDIPGHGAWGKGMPSIMGCDIVLDPTLDATYAFLNSFFGEMMTIFEGDYVFLGWVGGWVFLLFLFIRLSTMRFDNTYDHVLTPAFSMSSRRAPPLF